MLFYKFSNQLCLPATSDPRHNNNLGAWFDGTALVEQHVFQESLRFLSLHIMRCQFWHRWRENFHSPRMSYSRFSRQSWDIEGMLTQLSQCSKSISVNDCFCTAIYALYRLQVAKVDSSVGNNALRLLPDFRLLRIGAIING
jgi:hypothetical protein